MLDGAALELDRDLAIECKHFFSGAAAYANGRIFTTLTPAEPLAKDPNALTPWIEESIRFARKRPKSGTGSSA